MSTSEKRRSFYAFTLLGCVLSIAIVGLLNIWDVGISGTVSYKLIASAVVLSGLSGFLYTLTYNHDKKLVKKLGMITGIAAVALSTIILGQIWFDLFQNIIFGKLAFTLLIIGLLAGFGIAMSDDFFENKKMKDENYLD
jgi:hypothetical protein